MSKSKAITLTPEGLKAAEATAQWYLGDPWWASHIIWAGQNPEAAWDKLRAAGMDVRTDADEDVPE